MGEDNNLNEQIDYGIHEGAVRGAISNERIDDIDVSGLPIEVYVKDIDQVPNEEYAKIRKDSIGASDSSIILKVNPYKTTAQLIKEKATTELTEEEKQVGELTAVRKGRDLEPLIILKDEQFFNRKVFKPKDMYRFKDTPWLTLNFDGVYQEASGQYIPVEIKTVTQYGEKHYNKNKGVFDEYNGMKMLPENYSDSIINTIEMKANQYGIPPYYYTQLQVQMHALNAPYGYLSILFDKDWRFHSYLVYADHKLWNEYVIESWKVWQEVEKLNPSKKIDQQN